MKMDNRRKDSSSLNDRAKEERAERIARARERVKSGFYSSQDIISFLAEKMIVAAK